MRSSMPFTSLVRQTTQQLPRRCFSNSRQLSADFVRVIDCGPRDGLQNEARSIPVETKIELVRKLAGTGLRTIEAGSFVAPKWVPQMANSDKILESVLKQSPSSASPITYQWLLPNMKGLDNFFSVLEQRATSANSGQGGYPTPPPSPSNDSGPALNTSSEDPNAMPSSTSGVDSMSRSSRRSYSTASDRGSKPASKEQDKGPALNTSSENPNDMPSSTSGVDSMSKDKGGKPAKKQDSGPALNTSSENPNDMPSSTSGVDAMSRNGRRAYSTTTAPSSTPNVPNHEVSIFLAATETFSKRNTNCTIAESLTRFGPLIKASRDKNISVRAYISVALGCPFEGPHVSTSTVTDLAASLLEMGADEIAVADTTGMGTAPRTRELLRALSAAGIRNEDLALHFHDTFGQALMNVLVGLEHGVRTFDAAVGGLGGCPYSPGATGNVSTEDLVYTLHSLGAETGVDLDEVSRIGEWITGQIGKSSESRAGKATLARLKRHD